ncbi:hypothetical protein [Cyanothece sp. BG0011]|uniref:hypothetical protein n=1 Tax=Cyanothece sp. BG0011 TaxID=2082950 RepID=UPI000D1D8E04|nr:hypothetical protein [Cyanothece sp. BG0011]
MGNKKPERKSTENDNKFRFSGNLNFKFSLTKEEFMMILAIIAAIFGLGVGPAFRTEDIPHREQLPRLESQLESETKTSTNSK